MQSMFAQVATFAFPAVGALAILVGVIDQPQIAASMSGTPTGLLVGAALSPAVSPVA